MRTKVGSFFIFFQDLSNKKIFEALRLKMTKLKIASRGPAIEEDFTSSRLLLKLFAKSIVKLGSCKHTRSMYIVEGTGNRRFSPVSFHDVCRLHCLHVLGHCTGWFLHVLGHCPGHRSCVSFGYSTLPPARACEANDQRSAQR